MDHPRIIGICGSIGAGKDSVADYLVEKHGYQRLSWASPLKHVALYVYGALGAEPRHFNGTQLDKDEPIDGITDQFGEPQTGRRILQHLGTEGFREIDRDTWVKYGIASSVDVDPTVKWVVSDLRFPNEFDAVRSRGGVCWEVTKIGGPEHGSGGHSSEQAWKSVAKDAILVGRHGQLPNLYKGVEELLRVGGRVHTELLDG